MKKLYLIGGAMGVGKTSVGEALNKILPKSVFLDGDWCWKAEPFIVNEETKEMVLNNICYLLNNFLECSVYDNIIFCWVMHEQNIIDNIISRLHTSNVEIINISLIVGELELKNRLKKDIDSGLRSSEIIEKSLSKLPCYEKLNTIKIDTSNLDVKDIANKISQL